MNIFILSSFTHILSSLSLSHLRDYRGSRSAEMRHARSEMAKARLQVRTGVPVEIEPTGRMDEEKPGEIPL